MEKKPTSPGQQAINELLPHFGGRVNKLAAAIGVHRVTLGRWRSGTQTMTARATAEVQRLLVINVAAKGKTK
jgi:plasmid maintenance system antidote protein VapI